MKDLYFYLVYGKEPENVTDEYESYMVKYIKSMRDKKKLQNDELDWEIFNSIFK